MSDPKIVSCPACGTDMLEHHLNAHMKTHVDAPEVPLHGARLNTTSSSITAHAKVGFALLVVAAGLAFAASVTWRGATEEAESRSRVNRFSNAIAADQGSDLSFGDETIEPNRTPSIVLLGLAALAVLSAVPLIAIRPGGPSAAEKEPPRDLSARLTELAGLRANGALTDAEFDEAKRKLLDDPST